jgi:hypothetical protein
MLAGADQEEFFMINESLRKEVHPNDLRVQPTIKIDSQECVAGNIRIDARPTGRKELRGIISITVEDDRHSATAYFLPRHARELATTLLAIADKAEQFPPREQN